MSDSHAITEGIRVHVHARYLPQHSHPEQGQWLYTYTIRITNDGDEAAQLLTRHWIIEDELGRIEEVRGPGVVGCTPELKPGQAFEYSSYCPLPTPTGSMQGSFEMRRPSGERFDATVAGFRLDAELEYN